MLILTYSLLLLLLLFTSTNGLQPSFTTIETSKGAVRGKLITSDDQTGWAFAGIPHSKPPVGELRFKKLVEADPWNDVIDATLYRNACIANPEFTYKTKAGGPVSEDCMYLNVFTSNHCLQTKDCAVMGVIHGGNFNFESPVIFPMEIITKNFANDERNVIVVTIPYRIGTLGLFNLVPGNNNLSTDTNLAMRDCIYALEWIQKEITHFGGDPKRVTLLGHSSGGKLAYVLASSPATKGLMSQLIAMSGAIGDLFPTTNSQQSRRMAQLLQCAKEDEDYSSAKRNEQIISCIRSKTDMEILEKQEMIRNEVSDVTSIWIDGPGGVLPSSMDVMLANMHPMRSLIGTVSAEAREMDNALDNNGQVNKTRLEEFCMELAFLEEFDHPYAFYDACVLYYNNATLLPDMEDDLNFYSKAAKVANLLTSHKKDVFVYSFQYDKIGPAYVKYLNRKHHPSHSEDYVYLFGLHRGNFTPKDYEIEKIYSGMLANFVNTGNPSSEGVEWGKWNSQDMNHYVIDFDDNMTMPGMSNNYHKDAYNFWEITQMKTGGKARIRLDFPPGIDVVTLELIVTALVSEWKNRSDAHDKYLAPELEINRLFHEWVARNRLEYDRRALHHDSNSSTIIERSIENGSGSSWRTAGLISVGLLILLISSISIFKLCQCHRRRRSYESI